MSEDEGAFERRPVALDERITADGSSPWPVEAGRYRLIAARACPWAYRALFARLDVPASTAPSTRRVSSRSAPRSPAG